MCTCVLLIKCSNMTLGHDEYAHEYYVTDQSIARNFDTFRTPTTTTGSAKVDRQDVASSYGTKLFHV